MQGKGGVEIVRVSNFCRSKVHRSITVRSISFNPFVVWCTRRGQMKVVQNREIRKQTPNVDRADLFVDDLVPAFRLRCEVFFFCDWFHIGTDKKKSL